MIKIADKERELRLFVKSEREEARSEGREEGREESMGVISYLLARNRIEDLERASRDPKYMEQILEEIDVQKQASEE